MMSTFSPRMESCVIDTQRRVNEIVNDLVRIFEEAQEREDAKYRAEVRRQLKIHMYSTGAELIQASMPYFEYKYKHNYSIESVSEELTQLVERARYTSEELEIASILDKRAYDYVCEYEDTNPIHAYIKRIYDYLNK